jgi:cell division protein FtsW (lipid II flippase)
VSVLPTADLFWENNRRERLLLALAAAFVFLNAASYSLGEVNGLVWSYFAAPASWLVIVLIAHLLLSRYRPMREPFIFPLLALMMGWSLLMQSRLAPNFLGRQFIWFALGVATLTAITIIPRDLRWLREFRYTWLLLGLALLAATLLFGVNPTGFGPPLWLKVPFLPDAYFQPSELLKLVLVIFLSSYFDDREHLLWLIDAGLTRRLTFLLPLALMWGLSIVLLIYQRDLGTATLFFVVFLAMLYLATGAQRYIFGGLLLLLIAGVIGYFAFDVVALRVDAWWNPWLDADNRAYQIVQSLYALAAGNVIGQGMGQGFPDFVPVVHSDFIFAAIGEEWGLVGSLGVLALFAVLVHRGMRIANQSQRAFDLYLAAGMTLMLGTQAFLIMGGVTKLLPLTGVTMPFLSYGGSSLLVSCLMAGLLMFLSASEAAPEESP